MLRIRKLIHSALAPLIYREGWALVPNQVRHHWAQRQFVRGFIRRLNVDCIFDVGANIGGYAEELRLVGYKGLIVSFEPDKSCFDRIKERARHDPKWLVFNLALGDVDGTAELNIMAEHVFNSFLSPSTEGTERLADANKVIRRATVSVKRLDQLYDELAATHGFQRPYLKIDTQGYDMEVFRGAKTVRKRFVGMQSEVSFKQIYVGAPLWQESLKEFQNAGFEIAAMYAVHPESHEMIDMDCYLQRCVGSRET